MPPWGEGNIFTLPLSNVSGPAMELLCTGYSTLHQQRSLDPMEFSSVSPGPSCTTPCPAIPFSCPRTPPHISPLTSPLHSTLHRTLDSGLLASKLALAQWGLCWASSVAGLVLTAAVCLQRCMLMVNQRTWACIGSFTNISQEFYQRNQCIFFKKIEVHQW